MVYGYAGAILRIDLTSEDVRKGLTSEYSGKYLGGRGINARLMFEESPPKVSALDQRNPIIIGAGPLVGSGLIGAVRFEITCKSYEQVPEGFGNEGIGGTFGTEMKYAGYDHIVIKGKAKRPTYIYIENDVIKIKDASHLWGKGIFETNKLIREELGDPEVAILAIGQAGENLVKISTVEHEYRSGSAFGAIWGAKRLKAVAIRGTRGVKVHDAKKILEMNQTFLHGIKEWLLQDIKECEKSRTAHLPYPQYVAGEKSLVNYVDRSEQTITGYFKGIEWADIEKTRAAPYIIKRMMKQTGCCPMACIGMLKVPGIGISAMKCDSYYWPWQMYLTDMDKAFEATRLCADYGMDNQDMATPVSWLMHLYGEGIITARDTDGVPMEWGSGEALLHVIHSLANRKGFGDILADGILSFAKKIGPKAEASVMQRRGIVPNTDELRCQPAVALGTSVDPTCGRENYYNEVIWDRYLRETGQEAAVEEAYARARKTYGTEKAIIPWEYEKKVEGRIRDEYTWYMYDMFGSCFFLLIRGATKERYLHKIGEPFEEIYPTDLEMFKAVTGISLSEQQVRTFADRALNLEKAYNVREGFTRNDECVEEFWFKEPIPDGPQKGKVLDKVRFEEMKDQYYTKRGWDLKTSWPTKETYERLHLGDVAECLKKLGRLP